MRVRFFALLFGLLPVWANAQGFNGLGNTSDGFALPDRETRLTFPADHGPHPGFRIEWWYVTANLVGPDGTDYGAQWTLFRNAVAPDDADGWRSPVIWMAHAAVTTPDDHESAERFARGGIGQAGVEIAPFNAWIDDWSMQGESFEDLRITAQGDEFSYELDLTAEGPLTLHGDASYSQKSIAGHASHYYSQPFFSVTGTLEIEGERIPVTGSAWLDREWSSQLLDDDQAGWDWISLSFETGERMMGFRIRGSEGIDPTRGSWISAEGDVENLSPGTLIMDPLETTVTAGGPVPTRWRIRLPDRDIDVTADAINPQSWMDTTVSYWEGPMRISGSHTGRGYLEMTGYD